MTAARLAHTCDDTVCTHLLVRGDKISFVSVEQAKRVGCIKQACEQRLDEQKMPSDITAIPPDFVLVHDTTSTIFCNCDFFIVRWKSGGEKLAQNDAEGGEIMQTAREYFGDGARIESGRVEVPDGPWKKVCRVRFIRYHRYGYAPHGFEHEWEEPVWLSVCKKPLAWRVQLPKSCVVDDRGFVS